MRVVLDFGESARVRLSNAESGGDRPVPEKPNRSHNQGNLPH